MSLGGQVRMLHFDTRTVTKLAEVCNLESEYDASRRRLARKQEIKRRPWEVVMVCCLVMWCCWLVSDDHRRRACRETLRDCLKQGTPRASGVVCCHYGAGALCVCVSLSVCLLSHIIAQLHSPLARFTLPPQAKAYHGVLSYAQLASPLHPAAAPATGLSSHQINLPPVSSVPVTIAVAVTITLPSCTRPNGALQEAVATCNLQGPRHGAS